MNLDLDLRTPRILILDDERQVHSALRLRLARDHELSFAFKASEALAFLGGGRFDLCLVDIHMPEMDGLTFIKKAGELDPDLGFVVLTAFDTDENLRRAIPLQVYDFLGKPLPARGEFEVQIPEWIDRTRRRREARRLIGAAGTVSRDLDSARLAREVELVASEGARHALMQIAGLLTTISAHLSNATSYLTERGKADATAAHLWRGMAEARKTAEAAVMVAEAFFDSSYGNRDSSPALVATGVRHAINIASRMAKASDTNKIVDVAAMDDSVPVRNLSGIEFLLAVVPVIEAALVTAPPNSTIRIASEPLARLDAAVEGARGKPYYWLNRRSAVMSQPGILISFAAGAAALERVRAEAWLHGDESPLASVTTRGLVRGVRKAQGLFGVAVQPHADAFRLVLVLPT